MSLLDYLFRRQQSQTCVRTDNSSVYNIIQYIEKSRIFALVCCDSVIECLI